MSDTRRCGNCQAEVADDATSCPSCGQQLEAPVISAAAPPAPPAATPPPTPPPTPQVAETPPPGTINLPPWARACCGILLIAFMLAAMLTVRHFYQKAKAQIIDQSRQRSAPGSQPAPATQIERPGPIRGAQRPMVDVRPPVEREADGAKKVAAGGRRWGRAAPSQPPPG